VSGANDTGADDTGTGGGRDADAAQEPGRPVLRIVRGEPTPEELAALTAVLAAAAGGGEEPEPERPRSLWADRTSLVRRPLVPGRGAWRASARR
jgi:Acyl-CoA carboxylase epsilon subunit